MGRYMVIKMIFMNIINLFLSITINKKEKVVPLNDSILVNDSILANDSILVNDIETGLFHDSNPFEYRIDIRVV